MLDFSIRHSFTLFYSDVMLKGNPGHVIARNTEGCARLRDLWMKAQNVTLILHDCRLYKLVE